jgi:hypothetical protein
MALIPRSSAVRAVLVAVATFAADGKVLTATVWGTDASGSRFEQVIVFDRK